MVPLFELERAYLEAKSDASFQAQFENLLKNFAGRPTPLQFASRLTEKLGGPRIYLKREDLLHTGAHKINNALGQWLLAVKMGKPRIVAETGAGQHGVASATVAAHLGLECVVYMGTEDMARQALNVARMRMLGAEVMPVDSGSRTLKDAINEAMRDWVTNVRTTHYLLGSVLGAHPYPTMVRDFQTVIGREAREQILAAEKRLPTHLFACVGGGSNSIGLFHQFLRDPDVKMIGIEAGGRGAGLREHAARLAALRGFSAARPGVLQGTYTYFLQNEDGQIATTHSFSAGLDYPAIGPEHAWLADQWRDNRAPRKWNAWSRFARLHFAKRRYRYPAERRGARPRTPDAQPGARHARRARRRGRRPRCRSSSHPDHARTGETIQWNSSRRRHRQKDASANVFPRQGFAPAPRGRSPSENREPWSDKDARQERTRADNGWSARW